VLEPIELSREESESLLRLGVVGRVAVTTPDGPYIVPVNYSVVDDAVVLRTTPYSLLGRNGRDAVVAFEVDRLDHDEHHGWSVLARGRAEVVTDPVELKRIETSCPPRPWAGGNRPLFLRIAWTEISGRRLGRVGDPRAEMPSQRPLEP
jgi:nitroimidazol reductase NimA-like FMN-containing flavoprotein (pyridoxamine 5'-phosphate oxidase superfamily)